MNCFKTYDIRGIYPTEINEDTVVKIAYAFIKEFPDIKSVVIGFDARESGPVLAKYLAKTFMNYGVTSYILQSCGTEEVYFEVQAKGLDLGIMVTASHNPKEYNGLKFILKGGMPFSSEMLNKLKTAIENANEDSIIPVKKLEDIRNSIDKEFYWNFVSYVTKFTQPKHKIVVNCGNGTVGNLLKDKGFILLNEKPDFNFPKGVPNPMLPEMREETSKAVIEYKADFGVAFDGDFDRCFFFDNEGKFVDGYYTGGVLTKLLLDDLGSYEAKHTKIAYDTRLYWNTLDILQEYNTQGIKSKTGHVFVKECMREHDCLFGFENSGHHYFRNFAYCDSGIIPLLLMDQITEPLSNLVYQMKEAYPCSDEINFKIDNKNILDIIEKHYNTNRYMPQNVSRFDGLNIEFADWRFSLRQSNTEPLVRLNIETRSDKKLLEKKINELSGMIRLY